MKESPESLTEVSVLHKVGSFAVCDHIVVDSLCDADDACLLYHFISAAEFLFPVRRIFCADMAVGDHEICLSGGEAGKGGGVGIRLDRIQRGQRWSFRSARLTLRTDKCMPDAEVGPMTAQMALFKSSQVSSSPVVDLC